MLFNSTVKPIQVPQSQNCFAAKERLLHVQNGKKRKKNNTLDFISTAQVGAKRAGGPAAAHGRFVCFWQAATDGACTTLIKQFQHVSTCFNKNRVAITCKLCENHAQHVFGLLLLSTISTLILCPTRCKIKSAISSS